MEDTLIPDKVPKPILTSEQKEMIFENISDGVITINTQGQITYVNSACTAIFDMTSEDLLEHSFQDIFLTNKKNKEFNRLFLSALEKNQITRKKTVKYRTENRTQYFSIDISLVQRSEDTPEKNDPFPGMIILIDDVSERYSLKQHQHDCAYIFSGLIFCISIYLFAWSLLQFTLHIPLKKSFYTLMIEGITFILFLEIVFLTSFSLREIGLIPKRSKIRQTIKESLYLAILGCGDLILTKAVLLLMGFHIKDYFIGGSLRGAYIYLFTAFIQEFLARGCIQTSVKYLLRIKYQKQFSVILTSLLFSLMHLPFGFTFMVSAFFLSLVLGYLFERQENLWGTAFLHWICGYTAMCLFF